MVKKYRVSLEKGISSKTLIKDAKFETFDTRLLEREYLDRSLDNLNRSLQVYSPNPHSEAVNLGEYELDWVSFDEDISEKSLRRATFLETLALAIQHPEAIPTKGLYGQGPTGQDEKLCCLLLSRYRGKTHVYLNWSGLSRDCKGRTPDVLVTKAPKKKQLLLTRKEVAIGELLLQVQRYGGQNRSSVNHH